MYQLRLVVDTNCLNAKGVLAAMTELQQYHDVGAVELIVTSTLPVEIDSGSVQDVKAATYQAIGGRVSCLPGVPGTQSRQGATLRPSQLALLHAKLFPHPLDGHALTRAFRDCLHIDQAQMNVADVFVTNDKNLHRAEEVLRSASVKLSVVGPEEALIFVKDRVHEVLGTTDLARTKAHVDGLGPVIYGSNSGGNCSFRTEQQPDPLLTFCIENGFLRISGALRDENGQVAIVLRPGESPEFLASNVCLTEVGSGWLLVGSEPSSSFVVDVGGRPVLAVRTSHTGRAIVFALELRDDTGRIVASVEDESLILQGGGTARFG